MKKIFDVKAVIIRQPFEFAAFELLGRKICDYLALGLGDIPFTEADCEGQLIIPEKFDYLAVLYADMPLVTADVLRDVSQYMHEKCLEKVNFGRGYMVTPTGFTQFHADRLIKLTEFLSVNDTESLKIVYNEIKLRVINRCISNGVIILGDSVTIDDTAYVAAGAILSGATTVRGESNILSGARLDNCFIENSIVDGGEYIPPFTVIKNKR